jgi:uncharacterized DUF497 family protein
LAVFARPCEFAGGAEFAGGLYPWFALTIVRGQSFVWDSDKAKQNVGKHRIRFETAREVFFDPHVDEDASVPEETRLAVIGRTLSNDVLYVVNVDRGEVSIRIISAREASALQKRIHENGS